MTVSTVHIQTTHPANMQPQICLQEPTIPVQRNQTPSPIFFWMWDAFQLKYFSLISITWAFFNLELVIWENMKDIKIMSSSLPFLGVCLDHLINSKNSNKISFLRHIQMKFSIGHIGWLCSFFMKRKRLCMKMKRCILSGCAMWKILKRIPLGMYFFII